MNKKKKLDIIRLDTGFSFDEWRQLSKEGKVCGILGCFNDISEKFRICPHCLLYYCEEHHFVIYTHPHHYEEGDSHG